MQRAVMVNWIMEVSVCHSSCDLHSTCIQRFYFSSIWFCGRSRIAGLVMGWYRASNIHVVP
jgi:hypothetical protein